MKKNQTIETLYNLNTLIECVCVVALDRGKTKFTMDLLLEKHQPFDKIIWIAPEYSLKQVKMKNFIEMIGKHISVFSDINKDQPEIEKLIEEYYNKDFQTVIIIDDMMSEQNKFISNSVHCWTS
jgi:hypothetical protein